MQSSGSKPSDGQPLSYSKMPDFEDFGLGGFLLAGSEVYRLAKDYNSTTEIDNLNTNKIELSVYPNPFSKSVHITLKATYKSTNIFIMNVIGQVVFHSTIENNHPVTFIWNGKTADGKRLSNGVYIIYIQSGEQKQVKKIILER
jgi:flagellar hook assembly protein FlgD